MAEIIWSSGKRSDTSWREFYRPNADLRSRAIAEVQRVHVIVHARANSMFTCPICKRGPKEITKGEGSK